MLNTTINGYKILRYIDKGGMAEVWYAENRIGKPAAIKILLGKFCDDKDIVERFENEAKIMVALKHDHIRSVYDYEEIEGRPCIIMEYLDGESLSRFMATNNLFPEKQLIQWWNEMVAVLNYTHSKGVIHRDIKPSNIFLTSDGKLKLLDFGIAKVKESINITMTGQGLGTIIYMSPEQIKDPKRVTHQTDAYSLAVTFFHLLTGKQPYDRTSSSDFEIQTKIVSEPLNMALLPLSWRSFLNGYLEKDPAKRKQLTVFRDTSEDTVTSSAESNQDFSSGDNTIVNDKSQGKKSYDHTIINDSWKTAKNDDGQTVVRPDKESQKTTGRISEFATYGILLLIALPCLSLLWIFEYLSYLYKVIDNEYSIPSDYRTPILLGFLLYIVIHTISIILIVRFFKNRKKVNLNAQNRASANNDGPRPFILSESSKKLVWQTAIFYILAYIASLIATSAGLGRNFHINTSREFPEYFIVPAFQYIIFIGATFSHKKWPAWFNVINVIITLGVLAHLILFILKGYGIINSY